MKESNAPAVGRTPFQKWLDKYQGLFYLIPWIIGFVVFKAVPFGQSLYYSFTDMNFFKSGTQFVGLANYITAFTTTKITKALLITFKYAFITVPLKLVFALFIAYILNFKIACVNLFRTVYYIPSIWAALLQSPFCGRLCSAWTACSTPCCALSPLVWCRAPSGCLTPATRCGSSASCVSGSSVPPWCCSWPR